MAKYQVTDQQVSDLFERVKFLDERLGRKITKSNRLWLQHRHGGLCEAISLLGLSDELNKYLGNLQEDEQPKVDPLVEYFKRNPEKNDLWQ